MSRETLTRRFTRAYARAREEDVHLMTRQRSPDIENVTPGTSPLDERPSSAPLWGFVGDLAPGEEVRLPCRWEHRTYDTVRNPRCMALAGARNAARRAGIRIDTACIEGYVYVRRTDTEEVE